VLLRRYQGAVKALLRTDPISASFGGCGPRTTRRFESRTIVAPAFLLSQLY
jgi:hypothetical protein